LGLVSELNRILGEKDRRLQDKQRDKEGNG
jgi:hypothetical protein